MFGYRLLVPLGFGLLGLFVVAEDATACDCVARSACQTYARASAVFVAEVLDVAETATPARKAARMRVIRSYKGDAAPGQTVAVVTLPGTGANCSLEFAAGDRYVLFAGGAEGRYGSTMCHGSYRLAGAPHPDLPPPAGTVTGQLTRPGVTVWVETAEGRIQSRTDSNGRFRLSNVPTGMRAVRFDLDPGEPVGMVIDLQSADDCAEINMSPPGH